MLDLDDLNFFKKKDNEEHDNDGKSSCGEDSIDYGNGPAEWLFSPEKLRPLYKHGMKKFNIEVKEE